MSNINKFICIRAMVGIYFLYLLVHFFKIHELLYLTRDALVLPSFYFRQFFDQVEAWQLNILFIFSGLSALLFIFGVFQQLTALVMYLSLIFLIHANLLLMEIHYTYLGWIFAVYIFSPKFTNKFKDDNHREILIWWSDKLTLAALFVFGFSYTFLGMVKIKYSHYYNPELTNFLFSIPDAHPHNISYFNFLNVFFKTYLNDSTKVFLGLAGAWMEVLALPLIIFKKTRIIAFTLIFMVLGYISVFINYWNITIVMTLFQLMAIDLSSVKLISRNKYVAFIERI